MEFLSTPYFRGPYILQYDSIQNTFDWPAAETERSQFRKLTGWVRKSDWGMPMETDTIFASAAFCLLGPSGLPIYGNSLGIRINKITSDNLHINEVPPLYFSDISRHHLIIHNLSAMFDNNPLSGRGFQA